MTEQTAQLSPDDTARWRKQQKRKNWAILLALLAFVALVFLLTLTRMQNNVAEREKQQAVDAAIQGMEDGMLGTKIPAIIKPQTSNPSP